MNIISTQYGIQTQLSFTEEEEPEGQLCALCRHHHSHISKVSTWKRTQDKEFLADYGVNEDDFVCRPCRDDVRRLVRSQGPTQIPRWEKKKKEVRCCVKGCEEMCFAHYNSKDYSTVQVVFEATNLETKGDTIPFPTPLCTRHYYTVYNAQRAHLANCPVCGICLKHVQSRPCPNAERITEHLRDTAGFEISLQPEQKVCYSCYKSQLIILQEQELTSRQADLQLLLEEIKENSTGQPSTAQQARSMAMDYTAIYVGAKKGNPLTHGLRFFSGKAR